MVYELHNTHLDLIKLTAFVCRNENLLPDPLSRHVDIRSYCNKLMEFGRVFVYKDASDIHGVCMGYINDYQTFVAHLQVLLVCSEHQNKGVGTILIQHYISEAKKAGMRSILLTCDAENHPAKAFYKRMGFHVSDVSHPKPDKIFLVYSL